MINYTYKDMLKKHETNVKSAVGGFGLAGILGLIYILRYFIKHNFDFYFSISFTEIMLRLTDNGTLSPVTGYSLIGAFVIVFIAVFLLALKDSKKLKPCLIMYIFDCICLVASIFIVFGGSVTPKFFIDVIIHIFIILFLSVGVKSVKELEKIK